MLGIYPYRLLLIFLPTLVYLSSVDGIPIDNGVKDYPHVTCGPHSVQVDVNTLKPFNGRVYVKGESSNQDCVRAFRGGDLGYGGPPIHHDSLPPPDGAPYPSQRPHYGGQTVGLELKFGQCNMRRQRTLYPRGVEYTFTMVISFHPLFLTKVDRAYRVRCFYMEAEKTVQTNLDVSMLTTLAVNEQFPMPQCYYKLKRGGYDGPYVRFAKVGDKVVHVWQCDKVAGYVYGILVKNCYVDDGQGNKVELINDKGCAVDGHLVPDLTYDDHLISAYVETHVFKYADKPHLQFTCTVQLCFKNDGGCQGITPPNCGYGPLLLPSPGVPQGPLLPPPHPGASGALIPAHALSPHPHPSDLHPAHPIIPSDHHPHSPPDLHPAHPVIPPAGQEFPHPVNHGAPPPPPPGPPLEQGGIIHLPIPQPGPFPPHNFPGPQIGVPPPPLGPQQLNPNVFQDHFQPFKDDPIKQDKNDTKKFQGKRSIDARFRNLLEADVSTQPIVVLPFEELSDDDEQELNELSQEFSQEHRYKILPKGPESLRGICMTSSGFGILVSLFIAMFLFSSILTVLVARRQWSQDSGKA